MERLPDHIKGLLVTGAGVLVLSPDSLLVRLIAIDQWSMVFWRGALLSLALGAYVAVRRGRGAPAAVRSIGRIGVFVAGFYVASAILFVIALNHTSVANTLVIVSAAPLFAALFSRVFLREAVAPRTWAAILAAVAGIALLASGGTAHGTLGGDLAALATAACMAASMSMIRHARRLDMIPALALSGVTSALCVLPLASPLALDAGQAGLMALLGLVVLPVAFGAITVGPRYLPAPEVGLVLLLETVLGPLWVWLAIGEEPGPRALLGGAVVIAALALHSALGLRARRRLMAG